MSNTTEYKLSSLDKTQIKAAARKSLIAADSQYYSLSAKQQEHFRATMNEQSCQKVKRVLLDDLLNIQCSLEDVDEVWRELSLDNLNVLNWAKLLTAGIGDDWICLNEPMADNKSLLDFSTLYDYDHADYLFQEQARKKDSKDYKGTEYYAFRWPPWVRLLIDDNFYYSTFTSVATHLYDEIEATGRDYIDQLIPHKFVEGKEHGKRDKGGYRWDMQQDAGGLEKQLKELQHRWYPYLQKRWLVISKLNSKLEPAAYTKDFDWDNDPHRCFIFTNEATLKKIRWQTFSADCKPLMAEYSFIEKQLEVAIDKAKSFLDESYQDILKNFDPDVIKLRKKRKIIMSSDFLDDLEKPGHDDEPYE
ncbi:MAG: hypothetical protein V3V18_03435 [Methylococcales bacterium]